jgi:hypothetical protein
MINVDQFTRTVVALVDGFDLAQAESLFNSLFGGAQRVDIGEFMSRLNPDPDCAYPEVVDGLRTFVPRGYSKTEEGTLTKEEFVLLLKDMYAAGPEIYDSVIGTLFV